MKARDIPKGPEIEALPIPQCTEDDTINVTVMYGLWCVEQRVARCHNIIIGLNLLAKY